MASIWQKLRSRRRWLAAGLVVCLGSLPVGCGPTVAEPEPDSKVRLTQVLRLYQVFVEKHDRGPADEQSLRDFGQKLSAKERDEYLIGEDLESIFTSPRDKQKYVIQYNIRIDPGAETRAIAWEATGQDGMRFVALSMGYVEEYDEETLQQFKR